MGSGGSSASYIALKIELGMADEIRGDAVIRPGYPALKVDRNRYPG